MSDLLPEGEYPFTIKKCQKDTLSDGSEVLFLEMETSGPDGKLHKVCDIIQTQERLNEFLSCIGYPPGSMKLARGNAKSE